MTSERLVVYFMYSKIIQSREMVSWSVLTFSFSLFLACVCRKQWVSERILFSATTDKIKSNFKRTDVKTYYLYISDTLVSDSLTCLI